MDYMLWYGNIQLQPLKQPAYMRIPTRAARSVSSFKQHCPQRTSHCSTRHAMKATQRVWSLP